MKETREKKPTTGTPYSSRSVKETSTHSPTQHTILYIIASVSATHSHTHILHLSHSPASRHFRCFSATFRVYFLFLSFRFVSFRFVFLFTMYKTVGETVGCTHTNIEGSIQGNRKYFISMGTFLVGIFFLFFVLFPIDSREFSSSKAKAKTDYRHCIHCVLKTW